MSDCSELKQRTTFDFSCPLFSARQKPKNHSGERGIAQQYYTKKEVLEAINLADLQWKQVRNGLGLEGQWMSCRLKRILLDCNKTAQQALEELGIDMSWLLFEGIITE